MAQVHGEQTKSQESDATESPEVEKALGAAAVTSKENEARNEELDALLDDIDEVLEVNSEEFVRGFIQKGGE